MTTTIKTVLFASLIVAMILPFSTMDVAKAQLEDDDQRVAQKQTDIENNFNSFLTLQEKSDTVYAKISELQGQPNQNNTKLEELEIEMETIQMQLKQNEQERHDLYEIPQEKTDKLLKAMDLIQEEFSFPDETQAPES